MTRNRGVPSLLMHVDVSLPLWTVLDVYGSTRAISLLGTIVRPESTVYQRTSPPRVQQHLHYQQQQQPVYQKLGVHSNAAAALAATPVGTIPTPVLSSGTASYVETIHGMTLAADGSAAGGECTVCYERSVDCVLYSCGHMCLCYECALHLYRGGRTAGQGLCPICRAPIRDVIRAYRS